MESLEHYSMRKYQLLWLPLLAIVLYLFRDPIMYLIAPILGNKLFGLTLVPDWSSLLLLLVFSLGLVIQIYLSFLFVQD